MPGLTVTPLPPDVEVGEDEFTVSTYDWILEVEERREGTALLLRYNTARFEQPAMERLLADLERWLAEMAADVNRPIGDRIVR